MKDVESGMPDLSKMSALVDAAGGVTLSQAAAMTGIQGSTIQNWVKRGFAPATDGKRYQIKHLARFLLIDRLRDALTLEQIMWLLHYMNGDLEDTADDRIDDVTLYRLFCEAQEAFADGGRERAATRVMEYLITQNVCDPEPVGKALTVMVLAERGARLVRDANRQLDNLLKEEKENGVCEKRKQ